MPKADFDAAADGAIGSDTCGAGDLVEPSAACLADTEGACAGVGDLAAFDETTRLQVLAALTARFSASYLRWMGSRGILSYPKVRVLELLQDRGPTMMRELADTLGMTARNVTAIVDALEAGGLVARRPHPSDRRVTLVELSESGCQETRQGRGRAMAKVAAAFGTLSLDDQQRYAEILSELSALFCD